MQVDKGLLYVYRLFDIGMEVNLAKALKILEKEKDVHHFQIKGTRQTFMIRETPIVISWESSVPIVLGKNYEISHLIKIWSFGSVSIQTILKLRPQTPIKELIALAQYFENDQEFHQYLCQITKDLAQIINDAVSKPCIWEHYEDYLIYVFQEYTGEIIDKNDRVSDDLVSLLFVEKIMNFSNQRKDDVVKHFIQYGTNDYAIIHWNSSLIVDNVDYADMANIIEYALSQLLQLRYYDNLLDNQLSTLYQQIENFKPGIFFNPYMQMANTAALQYIELSEIIDKVGNAFKTTGDFYLASIYRSCTQKFYINDWRTSVSGKLKNLAEVAKLFHGEINDKRGQIMEIIIILLITIEVIHLIFKIS